MLTRNGVARYRPRPDWEFTCYLLHEVTGKEYEIQAQVVMDDWEDFIIDSVHVGEWDVTGLLTDGDLEQIDYAAREHYTEMCERMADYEDERGDWLRDQRKDYLAESRGE